ncbi:MAG: hypothetical protein ACTSYE_09385 [Alphaproteobacteria bacterium]
MTIARLVRLPGLVAIGELAALPALRAPAHLTDNQRAILLAVEDPAFDHHNGLDFSQPGQGMTTITQAITKFLYFDPFKPGLARSSMA